MDKATLGKTGLNVSRLSMGGLFVAGGGDELDAAVATMKRAYELGINYVDTAPGYGESETALGKIFARSGRPDATAPEPEHRRVRLRRCPSENRRGTRRHHDFS